MLAALATLVASPASAAGPRFSNLGGVGSSASTFADGEPTGGTFTINGRTGAVTAPNLPISPLQYLNGAQSTAQLLGGLIDARPTLVSALGRGGRHVQLPCGTFRIDAPIVINFSSARISGGQSGCTTIVQNFASGSAFTIDGAGTGYGIDGIAIDHLKVVMAAGVTKTIGASFFVRNAHNVQLSYNRSDGDYIAFDLRGGPHQFGYKLAMNEVNAASYAAFLFTDDGDPNNQVRDVYMTDNSVGGGGFGMLVLNASGILASNMDICCGARGGVAVAPPAGKNVNAMQLSRVWADETVGTEGGYSFPNSGGFVTEVRLTDCWGSGAKAGAGLTVANPNVDGMQVVGFQGHYNWNAGIDIQAGKDIGISGAHLYENSLSGMANLPGALISGTADHVTFADGFAGLGGFQAKVGFSNRQNYGLVVSGQAAHVMTHDNQFFGNQTGGLLDSSSQSSTNRHHDNLSQ